MPGCAAIGCSNSAKKGFLMKHFPKDLERRKLWLVKMKRDNWVPTNHSCICEVHFEDGMWEKTREDGSRRLKYNSVPTVFSFTKQTPKRKAPKERSIKSPESNNVTEEVQVNSTNQLILENFNSIPEENLQSDQIKYQHMLKKMKEYEHHYKNATSKANMYKKRLQYVTNKLNNSDNNKNTKILNSVFNTDQIKALNRNSTKFMKWSNVTITKALKLKFSCGTSGYEELLKQKIPLPSLRTLRRRLQNLKFDTGILDEVFKFLEVKIQTFKNENEKDCVLVMDEMAITPGSTYDVSTNSNQGKVSLPNHDGTATNVLVFMLGGIATRWKQIVAYYFTGKSVDGTVYHKIITDIIHKSHDIGLNIVALVSDMGSSNRSLWKKWNITTGRHCIVSNYIPHPLENTRKLYIIADVPHLFKNIKNMLMTNQILFISDDLQKHNNLPTNKIYSSHIVDIIDFQEKLHFLLVPKLSEQDLMPNHFQKMKVGKSTNVINHDVCAALRFLAEELKKPEYLTTAWFINMVDKWFSLMTSRHPILAISKMKPEIYEDTIKFLNNFKEMMTNLHVGHKRAWKPSQTGAIISTTSIIDLQKYFLEDRGFNFLLTSRFTQDCLENLFSILRTKNIVPNALQVKNNLKLLSVSQYLKDVSKGNYDEDDRILLSDFLDVLNESEVNRKSENIQLPEGISEPNMDLCNGTIPEECLNINIYSYTLT